MDKTIAGLLGAATLLGAANPAQAAMPAPLDPAPAMQARSYADLLRPIPNAVALLEATEAADARAELLPNATDGDATVQQAQFHHHHHHRFFRRFHHHHHHHRFFRRFHHHHHHHRFFRRDDF